MKAEKLCAGDVVTSTGDVVIGREVIDHGTYVAVVVRASNGVVHLRHWDKGHDVTLRCTFTVENGPRRVVWRDVVRYFGGEDAAEAAFRADHITEHYTRDDVPSSLNTRDDSL